MSKFHINKHGVPAPCKATKGNCPLGGNDSHFRSEEEAQAFVNNRMENEYGLLGGTPSPEKMKYEDPAEDDILLRAASAKEAYRLLKSEAVRLLEDGWEVIRISKRSYIAVQDGCEIYLHTCKKGVSARVFQYENR